MNWKLHYDKLIDKRRLEKPNGYTESHHAFPSCQGGSDIPENIVDLTAREHLFAHLLLVKINPGHYGLLRAANMMSNFKKYGSRKYAWLKEKFHNTPLSLKHRQRIAKSLIGIKHTEERRQNQSKAHKGLKLNFSEIHRENLSRSRKGMKFSENHCRNISKANSQREFIYMSCLACRQKLTTMYHSRHKCKKNNLNGD